MLSRLHNKKVNIGSSLTRSSFKKTRFWQTKMDWNLTAAKLLHEEANSGSKKSPAANLSILSN